MFLNKSPRGSVMSSRLPSRNVSPTELFSHIRGREGAIRDKPGTKFFEALMHHFKGNIGTGIFAMGQAFEHAGFALGCSGLILLGSLNLYCQHQLVFAAQQVAINHEFRVKPDYAETVLVCFMDGPEMFRGLAFTMKKVCNFFLVLTQMGFCCVYIIFLGESIDRMLRIYDIHYDIHLVILFTFLPLWLMSLVSNLKVLVPLSIIANIVTLTGMLITFYYNIHKVENPNRLPMVGDMGNIPLFFGMVTYAFESIGLVLPLYNELEKPEHLNRACGILNIGMGVALALNFCMGTLSYAKWGKDIKSSVTLNLPEKEILAQSVVCLIALGITVTYVLQLYVAHMILFSIIYRKWAPFKHRYVVEYGFRTFLTIAAFILAESIPFLGLFIALVGAVGGGFLALVFPPILEMIVFYEEIGVFNYVKNSTILLVGLTGISTGTYTAIAKIIEELKKTYSKNH